MLVMIRQAGIKVRMLGRSAFQRGAPDLGLTIFGCPTATLNMPRYRPNSTHKNIGDFEIYLWPLFTLWERMFFANFFCLHYSENVNMNRIMNRCLRSPFFHHDPNANVRWAH